jgi:hypothetical protein
MPMDEVPVDSKVERGSRWAHKWLFTAALVLALVAGLPNVVAAAEFAAADDVYILPQGAVISDDLYVVAPEIIINGTIEGDLLATGRYVEVNGAVNGSLMVAAVGVQVNGVVQETARLAAVSALVDGSVRNDLLITAGLWPGLPQFPITIEGRSMTPGIMLTRNSSVGGDALLTGSTGAAGGTVGGDFLAAFNRFDFAGRVSGDAEMRAASLSVQDTARVEGELRYASRDEVTVPAAVSSAVVVETWEEERAATTPAPVNPMWRFFGWLWRVALQLLGVGLIAWLLWTFAPRLLSRPADALAARPAEAGLYGFVALAAAAPLALGLVFLAVVFWGWFSGGVVFSAALFGLLSIGWLLSPLVTGLWVGRKVTQSSTRSFSDFQALLVGIVAIVLIANILGAVPCVGPLAERIIYILSFALAAGGYVLTRIRPAQPRTPVITAAPA